MLATQTLWQRKPKAKRITVEGSLGAGVTAKDVILAIIAKIGADGAVGHAIEYAGSTIRGLSIEGRLTVCNMSIEAGARAGVVAPDDTTIAYLEGRPYAPKGEQWEKAVSFWRSLPSDNDARFDSEVALDAASIAPMVTWGTSPQDAAAAAGACYAESPREAGSPRRGCCVAHRSRLHRWRRTADSWRTSHPDRERRAAAAPTTPFSNMTSAESRPVSDSSS